MLVLKTVVLFPCIRTFRKEYVQFMNFKLNQSKVIIILSGRYDQPPTIIREIQSYK